MFKYLNKGISTPIAISIIVLIAVIVGGGILAYQYWWLPKEEANNVACTMEAKLCPDGSYVGRTGPNCEFAECPVTKADETADWKTYKNEEYGFEIKYPLLWESPIKGWEGGWTAGKSLDNDNYCIVDISVFSTSAQSNIVEIADLLRKGYIQTSTKIGGIAGIRLTHSPSEAGLTEAVYFSYKGNDFRIGRNRGLKTKIEEECIRDFDQMLSTFRFLETSSGETKAILVYLTDNKYNGNLGGRQGADAKCNPPSGLECKPGTVHALITVNSDDSIKNVAKNYNFDINTLIYWYNRETSQKLILANSWNKMIEGNIENGQKEGTGKGEWSGDFPWTGGLGDGNALDCNQWTSNGGDLETAAGPYGTIGGVDKEFLFASDGWAGISFSMVCKNTRYLRCICEGSI